MALKVHEDPWESEIQRCREQLAACSSDHPQRSNACHDLASSLHRSWKEKPSTALLAEAATLHRDALNLRPGGHPDRALSCNSLANALLDQYRVAGGPDVLNETVELHREALCLRLGGHPDYAMYCNDLANALLAHYWVTGSSALLEEAIKLHREALALRPGGHLDRAMSCNNLANALLDRYQAVGNSALLEEAIVLHREALALRPSEHSDRATSCSGLASALLHRYKATGSSALLDEAVKLRREVHALHPAGHPDRAVSCNNLANALWRRYHATGGSVLLEETIALHREALALRPAGHPDRGLSYNNLANVLRARYRATGISAFLDDAITSYREALALQPVEHPYRAMSYDNLAGALLDRYQITGTSTLLEEVIKLHREALALRPVAHPDRALSCYQLADSLWQLSGKTQDAMVIDQALALAHESATSWSPSDSWQAWLLLCSIHLEQWSPHFSISTAVEHLLRVSSSIPFSIAEFMDDIQGPLDRMWLMHGMWTPDATLMLLDVYSNIIDRLSRMTGFAFDLISQLTALRSARSFGSDACMAALLSGRPRQAIEQIDHAHGVIWAQALHQRDPHLQDIPRSLASELEALLQAVSMPVNTHAVATSNPDTPYLSPEDIRHQQNSRIQTILTEVRAMPGLERFMLGRTYTHLRETASEHPVVVLVSARGHSYALIIRDSTQEAPDEIHLKLTSDRLSLLRDTAARGGLRQGGQAQVAVNDLKTEFERAIRMSRHKEATPLATLADLWHNVVKPVVDHLQLQPATGRAKPRLHWCPTADFAFLPIHAAGIYDGPEASRVCCSDYVVSSYAPTLSALLNAQSKAPQTAPSRLDILAVGEDARTSPTMQRLWFVERELTTVENTAKASKRDCTVDTIANHATVDLVTARIQTAHFVHFACHGTQDQTNALDSGFHLTNGKLTVSQLVSLNLDKAWFAYLSACETAKNDAQQPEQAVHIAAAMLHAGFKSVVATMWSMGDVDGPDMAQWFYEDLLSNEVIDADAVAYALDAAVEKLRAKIPRAAIRWAPYIHMGA